MLLYCDSGERCLLTVGVLFFCYFQLFFILIKDLVFIWKCLKTEEKLLKKGKRPLLLAVFHSLNIVSSCLITVFSLFCHIVSHRGNDIIICLLYHVFCYYNLTSPSINCILSVIFLYVDLKLQWIPQKNIFASRSYKENKQCLCVVTR